MCAYIARSERARETNKTLPHLPRGCGYARLNTPLQDNLLEEEVESRLMAQQKKVSAWYLHAVKLQHALIIQRAAQCFVDVGHIFYRARGVVDYMYRSAIASSEFLVKIKRLYTEPSSCS